MKRLVLALTLAVAFLLPASADTFTQLLLGVDTTPTPSPVCIMSPTGVCAAQLGTWNIGTSTWTPAGGSLSFPQTVAGTTTSGGVPYFSSTTQLASSGLLTANALMVGGGAGAPPSTVTTGTGVVTALGIAVNNASGFPLLNATLPTIGHCLQWGASGVTDAGGSCTTGGGGGTVASGTAGQLAYYASTGTVVSGATTGAGVLTALGLATNALGGVLTTPSAACTSGKFLTFLTAGSVPTCATPAVSGLTVGATTIASGTNGYVEYNNGGILGEKATTGTGNVVLSASPTFSGTIGGTGIVPFAALPSISANTVLGQVTSGVTTTLAIPGCSGAGQALNWTTGGGFGCATTSGGGTISSASVNQLAIYTAATTVGGLSAGTAGKILMEVSGSSLTELTDPWASLASGAGPKGSAIDASGNVWTANYGNNTVSKVTPSATVTNYSLASGAGPIAIAFDSSGNAFITNALNSTVSKITTGGTVTQAWATLSSTLPWGIVIDTSNNVFIGNAIDNTISKITSAGSVTQTWATLASGAQPEALAIDSSLNIYTANFSNNTISKITSGASVTQAWATLASGAHPVALSIDGSGNVYSSNKGTDTISKVTPSAVVTQVWASLAAGSSPIGISFDSSGNLYTANSGNNTISQITSAAVVTQAFATLASGAAPWGLGVDTSNNVYTANNGNNTISKAGAATVPAWATLPGPNLPPCTSTVGGAVPTPPNNTTTFLRGDCTFASVTGGGGGNVSNTGTPTSGQLAGWTNATTIQGITVGSGLSLAGTTLTATGGGGLTNVYDITAYGCTASTAIGSANQSTCMQSAINAANTAGGGVVWVPIGFWNLTAQVTVKPNVTIRCASRGSIIDATTITYGTGLGSTFAVKWGSGSGNSSPTYAATYAAFILNHGAGVQNCGFWYPSQTTTSTPTEYGPSILAYDTSAVANVGQFAKDNWCYNCYVFIDFRGGNTNPGTGNGAGRQVVTGNTGSPISIGVAHNFQVDWVVDRDNYFNSGWINFNQTPAFGNLKGWIQTNGVAFYVGHGNTILWDADKAFGYNIGFQLDMTTNCCVGISTFDGPFRCLECDLDNVNYGFWLSGGSGQTLGSLRIIGGSYALNNVMNTNPGYLFYASDAIGVSGLQIMNVQMYGYNEYLMYIANSNVVTNVQILGNYTQNVNTAANCGVMSGIGSNIQIANNICQNTTGAPPFAVSGFSNVVLSNNQN